MAVSKSTVSIQFKMDELPPVIQNLMKNPLISRKAVFMALLQNERLVEKCLSSLMVGYVPEAKKPAKDRVESMAKSSVSEGNVLAESMELIRQFESEQARPVEPPDQVGAQPEASMNSRPESGTVISTASVSVASNHGFGRAPGYRQPPVLAVPAGSSDDLLDED